MREIKKLIIRLLFVGEIALFIFYYFFGNYGLPALLALEGQNCALKKELIIIKSDIKLLKKEVTTWQNSRFKKEKFAREQLQMAYPDEDLYRYPP